jgi:lipopolysaccharide transport system ATP-binding protein
MGDLAISIEALSKRYRLGNVGTGTLSHDLKRWWALTRGKEDPMALIGQENVLTDTSGDYVYALKEINLQIKQGDIIGIIGKNGAGKSTLLKILSRVTSPSSGIIDIYGRVASLLEVGTGFHPELTGRENVFLNGAIMGMTKQEIKTKFDEIVDFSGVNKYIDTPVKRYSSGMYVRLAFAVAAHLDPEILIVDEVLAVGDIDFQKKAIGKMQEVSKSEGRTVLFVSHNMTAVENLCNKTCLISNGKVAFEGDVSLGIKKYLNDTDVKLNSNNAQKIEDDTINLIKFEIYQNQEIDNFKTKEPLTVSLEYEVKKETLGLRIGFDLIDNSTGITIFRTFHDENQKDITPLKIGINTSKAEIPPSLLKEGNYSVCLSIGIHNVRWISNGQIKKSFNVFNIGGVNKNYAVVNIGAISPYINWQTAIK